ncbi:MAG: rod shape-determining protein RodA [Alphaproteobacteria bacterium]
MYYDLLSPIDRLKNLNIRLILVITLLSCIGFMTLYSAAGGAFFPWALPQILRFLFGFILMILIAISNLQWWFNASYLFYGAALCCLVAVELFGKVGMGAQRWLDLYLFKLQPSELIKLSLVLALATYFHRLNTDDVYKPTQLIVPLGMIFLPALFVLKQPDLGTTILLVLIGLTILFVAGVRMWYFLSLGIGLLVSLPFAWAFLKDYQRNRVLTFLNPEKDPQGTGYHIMQSKIAIGSGGILGKGYLKGTQGYLNFLPEKQTDFIFTLFSEEFGLMGSLVLITLYVLLLSMGVKIALKNKTKFGQLLSFGITMTIFIYLSINLCMVLGLVPVVGVPMPLISYGGTSMITLMIAFGLLLNTDVNYQNKILKY